MERLLLHGCSNTEFQGKRSEAETSCFRQAVSDPSKCCQHVLMLSFSEFTLPRRSEILDSEKVGKYTPRDTGDPAAGAALERPEGT